MKILCLKFFLFCILLNALAVSAAEAASRSFLMKKCRQEMKQNPPSVVISYNFGKLSYNNNLSAEEIKKEYAKIAKVSDSTIYHGLTLLSFYKNIAVFPVFSEMKDGIACVYPEKVEVKIGFTDPTIFIDNTLDRNSCVYRKTLRHELQHLDDAHTFLTYLVKNLKKDTLNIVNQIGPQLVKETGTVKWDYEQTLDNLIEDHYRKWRERAGMMDSPENYAAEQKLCR
ncbi:MAG: hypothetical protein Q4D80_06955 [Pseudomonadota bacterium]|nr:hypothetical protein [Pseudomonadota bacterium]